MHNNAKAILGEFEEERLYFTLLKRKDKVRNTASFTLLELLIVIVIIGVLGTLGIMQFGPAREQAFDSEVQANLRLILAAERTVRMETNSYVACANTAAVNTNLRLILPRNNPVWLYSVPNATATTFCAQATRNGGNGRSWRIRSPTAAIPDPQPVRNMCP